MPAKKKKEPIIIKIKAPKPRNPFVEEMILTKKAKEIPSKKEAGLTRDALKKDLRRRGQTREETDDAK